MRTLNIHTYEEFIIDYFDGTLSAEEIADLLLFLEQHPDIKTEFELFSNTPVTELEEITFDAKDKLKKGLTYNNETIVAYLERDLPLNDVKEFETALTKNIKLKKEVAQFKKTFLAADTAIIFSDKKDLKRDSRIVWLFAYAAAASVLFFLMYNAINFSNENTKIKQELAHTSKTVDTKKEKKIVNSFIQNKVLTVPNKKQNKTKIVAPKYDLPIRTVEGSKDQVKKEIIENNKPETEIATVNKEENENNVSQLPEEEKITTLFAENNTAEINSITASQNSELTLADVAKEKINKFLNKTVGYNKKQKADGTLTAYQFSAGDFEFSKTLKSKK